MKTVIVRPAVPVLFVTDVEGAVAHYQEALGFEVAFFNREFGYAGMQRDGVEIHLGQGTPTGGENKGAGVYLFVENLNALLAQLQGTDAYREAAFAEPNG